MSLHRSVTRHQSEDVEVSTPDVWSFAQFWARLYDAIGLDQTGIDPNTRLREELDFDSLHMAELVVFMDELGCELPEDLIPVLQTPADLYDHYVTRITAEAPRGAS